MAWKRTVTPLAAGGGLLAAAGWRFADLILEAPGEAALRDEPLEIDRCAVVAAGGDDVTLAGVDVRRAGRWGLIHAGGYGQVGAVLADTGTAVRRAFTVLAGDAPRADTDASFHAPAWPDDPSTLGRPWEEATYRSTAGALPAWLFPGEREGGTWAVFVHGRAGRRNDAFRFLGPVLGAGLTGLVISYRNDVDSLGLADGRCHLGDDEWEDVEGAVVHALASGARDVVLVGYSMGGAIVSRFLRTSAHADHVRGVILDSPVLRWQPVLWRAAEQAGVPTALLPIILPPTLALLRVRAGIDLDRLDTMKHSHRMHVPTLIVHGDADERVPIRLSRVLAERQPDVVQLLEVPGAGHVRAWNADPDAVERAVTTYLRDVMTGRTRRPRARHRVLRHLTRH